MSVLKLKEIMVMKGVSRDELAKRVEVSVTTISNITSEKNLPSIPLLLKIADSLNVDIRDLFVPTIGGSVSEIDIQELRKHSIAINNILFMEI